MSLEGVGSPDQEADAGCFEEIEDVPIEVMGRIAYRLGFRGPILMKPLPRTRSSFHER
jgi:hypothetical protein